MKNYIKIIVKSTKLFLIFLIVTNSSYSHSLNSSELEEIQDKIILNQICYLSYTDCYKNNSESYNYLLDDIIRKFSLLVYDTSLIFSMQIDTLTDTNLRLDGIYHVQIDYGKYYNYSKIDNEFKLNIPNYQELFLYDSNRSSIYEISLVDIPISYSFLRKSSYLIYYKEKDIKIISGNCCLDNNYKELFNNFENYLNYRFYINGLKSVKLIKNNIYEVYTNDGIYRAIDLESSCVIYQVSI